MIQDKFGTFYSTVCHVCKRKINEGSLYETLKKCQGCRLISYCSVEHQRIHWSQHRSFCKGVQTLMKNLNVSHIFENALTMSSSKEWCQLRTKIKMLCEITLKRSLSTSESEMLYFPPLCLFCRSFDSADLKVCERCYCVSYCSDEHLKQDVSCHSKSCMELKLGFDLDVSAFQGTLPEVDLEFGDRKFCLSAESFSEEFIKFASTSNKLSNHLVSSIYFTILSCPLTFIYTIFKTGLHLSQRLIVHLVGAGNFEIQHLPMWDVVFHWLPNLKYLHLILVGPDVFPTSQFAICSFCEKAGNHFTVEFCPGQLYHTYVASSDFIKPDIIVMYNCGLSEFIGGQEDTWQNSIPCIMTSNCPVMITSYTAKEAENDISRLLVFDKEIEVVIRCEKNTFSARKPMRDWEQFSSQSCSLVFYHNAMISILVPKSK